MADVGTALDAQTREELGKRWWVYLVFGLFSVVAGIILLVWPGITVLALAILIAVAFFLNGLGDLAASGRWTSSRWVPIVWGVLSIIAGLVAIIWPGITLWALAVVIGIALIIRGVVRIFGSVTGRPHLWALWAIVGLIELVVGILAIAWPGITILALAIVIALDLIFLGLAEIIFAFEAKKAAAS